MAIRYQWRQMYPGPSPAQWNQWQPRYGQGNTGQTSAGQASLFEAPYQLSAVTMDALFSGASAYSLVPKNKSARATKTPTTTNSTEVHNRYDHLTDTINDHDQGHDHDHNTTTTQVPIENLLKPTSSQQAAEVQAEGQRDFHDGRRSK